ncbi:metal ABC transporter substrate-binding protein [Pseudobutyrivibrio xylanivorans]|uniref:Zinc transport system substrate-binding protein n=1 Tax=Pseudobutyrivibrio xylanivorans DSM 14809 TaxID=1123012 RepID=A0A1M6A6N9_PSEXY|nr:metal ABC transporter substrate-binding protein [Pseudobutyrivibrio xylanivorans]SHI32152.1 zinc transport system substrate-binding protein [Pseudobutyrivibrio xylanivorans DSM 14809]
MKNKYLFVLLLLISITVVCSIGTFFYVKLNNEQTTNDDEILVMTSCNPVYIATLNILDGVEGYKVQNLSQPTTGCLHDYTLTTEDMKNLSKADVLVVNGGGMEGYLDDVVAAYPDLKIIDTYEAIEHSNGFIGMNELLIEEEELDHDHEDEEAHEEEHHHDHGANSHIWMDDRLYACQVAAIANELMGPNPNREETPISKNFFEYSNKLEDEIDKQGLDVAVANENVAILHEAFAYTAQSLGANVVATMDLDEERQVSAGEVSAFLDEIKEHNVKLVFAEYDYGNAMGKLIEEQTDAKVVYLETLVHGTYDKDSYIFVQNNNYMKIKETL